MRLINATISIELMMKVLVQRCWTEINDDRVLAFNKITSPVHPSKTKPTAIEH